VAFLAQLEVASHTANLPIGEVADQLPNRARSNVRPKVHEDDHIRCGFRHTSVYGDCFASALFKNDGMDMRMVLAGQQFCCTVG